MRLAALMLPALLTLRLFIRLPDDDADRLLKESEILMFPVPFATSRRPQVDPEEFRARHEAARRFAKPLRQYLARHPDAAPIRERLVEADCYTGDYDEAIEQIERGEATTAENQRALGSAGLALARAALQPRDDDPFAVIHFPHPIGTRALNAAEGRFRKALAIEPHNFVNLQYLSLVLHQRSDIENDPKRKDQLVLESQQLHDEAMAEIRKQKQKK